MKKIFSLKNIALATLIIIGGAFMFASSRSDSSTFTADISTGEVAGQIEPQQETEPQISPPVQSPVEETAPVESIATQNEQPKEETAPNTIPTQANDSEQSSTLIGIAVEVDPSSVKPGESITITISTPGEIFSIIQIDAYLESPTGLNKINGAVVNVNGDGKRFGSISIPSDAEQGTWKIKKIETMDNTGSMISYHYGTDFFTTFVVAQ